jgi:hypothetical protein
MPPSTVMGGSGAVAAAGGTLAGGAGGDQGGEVIEATVMDRRWQLVLDCPGAQEPPFSEGDPGGVPRAADRA